MCRKCLPKNIIHFRQTACRLQNEKGKPYGAPLLILQTSVPETRGIPRTLGHCLFLNVVTFFLSRLDQCKYTAANVIAQTLGLTFKNIFQLVQFIGGHPA